MCGTLPGRYLHTEADRSSRVVGAEPVELTKPLPAAACEGLEEQEHVLTQRGHTGRYKLYAPRAEPPPSGLLTVCRERPGEELQVQPEDLTTAAAYLLHQPTAGERWLSSLIPTEWMTALS